jgi:hypothetical protein
MPKTTDLHSSLAKAQEAAAFYDMAATKSLNVVADASKDVQPQLHILVDNTNPDLPSEGIE